jgi:hypothetical protein
MICLPILHMELQSRNHHKRDYISIYEKANWGVHDTWDFSVAQSAGCSLPGPKLQELRIL